MKFWRETPKQRAGSMAFVGGAIAGLGFLLAGLGLGVFVRELDIPQYIWAFYIAAAFPLLPLVRLLLCRSRKKRKGPLG